MALERRKRLRLETAPLHRLLGHRMEALGMFAGLVGYNTYLMAAHIARSQVEACLEASSVVDIYPDWPGRRVTPSIEEDLTDLGIPVPSTVRTEALASGPMSVGAMLGALYVLEGSALGARVIAPRLLPLESARHSAGGI
jgi:heme oxygenase